MKHATLFTLLLVVFTLKITAQQVFTLKNPSFEQDKPNAGQTPSGWINLGASSETPSDIQPGAFEVTLKAQDGKVYAGLTVRDNNTWEGIGQRLSGWLQKDSAYTFSVWLARSPVLMSNSRATQQFVNYNAPTVLKIWGINSITNQEELLAESEAISHSKWALYTFTLKPTVANLDEIDLMAYYARGFEQKNGNLMIDNCSAIEKAH